MVTYYIAFLNGMETRRHVIFSMICPPSIDSVFTNTWHMHISSCLFLNDRVVDGLVCVGDPKSKYTRRISDIVCVCARKDAKSRVVSSVGAASRANQTSIPSFMLTFWRKLYKVLFPCVLCLIHDDLGVLLWRKRGDDTSQEMTKTIISHPLLPLLFLSVCCIC